MGDIQEEKGKQVVQEFEAEFGTNTAFFCKVDVTKIDDIKGKSMRKPLILHETNQCPKLKKQS